MANIWFSVTTDTQDGIEEVFAAARIAFVKHLAKEEGWEFDGPTYDKGVNDYWISAPDERVGEVLRTLHGCGVAPGTIDFTNATSKEEAQGLATIVCEWERDSIDDE